MSCDPSEPSLTRPACAACGNAAPRGLLIVMSRAHPDRPPRFACRPGVDGRCLAEVSPAGHAADALALLVPPTPDELAALRSAVAPRSQP